MPQANLDRLQAWCVANKMAVSVHKCSVISFSRRATSDIIQWPYKIDVEPLLRCQQVNDLSMLMDIRLTFKSHLHQVVLRAKATWVFVKRQAKEFNWPYVAKSLYCALVRSKLEYCSVVWSPTFEYDKSGLESVQKQFLLFGLSHLNWQDPFVLPPYDTLLGFLNLESLLDASWRIFNWRDPYCRSHLPSVSALQIWNLYLYKLERPQFQS